MARKLDRKTVGYSLSPQIIALIEHWADRRAQTLSGTVSLMVRMADRELRQAEADRERGEGWSATHPPREP